MENENYKKLRAKILLDCTYLTRIEVGQVFDSKYYGNIVATKVEKVKNTLYSIYGFDTKDGLPRSFEYRTAFLNSDLELVGKEPVFSDVLFWFNGQRYTYGSIDVDGFNIIIHLNFCKKVIKWDLSKCYLKDQSIELIEFLNEI